MGLTQLPWRGKLRLGCNLRELFMATPTFDTLKFANTLKAAGVPDKQAEAQNDRLTAKIDSAYARLANKIDNFAAKCDGQFSILKWMIVLSITLNFCVVIRLFFIG